MRRWLFNLLALLSLLVCIASLALWARSYWFRDEIALSRGRCLVTLASGGSGCDVEWTTDWPGNPAIGPLHRSRRIASHPMSARARPIRSLWNFSYQTSITGVGPDDGTPGIPTRFHRLAAPLWLVTLITAALPAHRLRQRRSRARRRKLGLCVQCGYDLRSSKDRCPECATPIHL